MSERTFSLVVAFVLVHAIGVAQRLPSRMFTTADGHPHNVVTRIVRDSRGYQWFCTGEGLAKFDGNRFITYAIEAGLPSGEIHDLLETRDGTYFVATRRGLVRFDPMGRIERDARQPMFSVVPTTEPAKTLSVSAVVEDRAGHVWVGTLSGLYRLTASANNSLTLVNRLLACAPSRYADGRTMTARSDMTTHRSPERTTMGLAAALCAPDEKAP
jgi:ligand-binding sensor domain-containing protein